MITAELLREWGACWFNEDAEDAGALIARVAAGRTRMAPREVAGLQAVSLDDRLWVVCRALGHRSEERARRFAIDSAGLVSHLAGNERDQAEHARLVEDLRRIYALPDAEREPELDRWAAAWNAAWSTALQKATDRALSALGPDADGWE